MKRLLAAFALCAALGGALAVAPSLAAAAAPAVMVTEAPPATLQVGDSFQVSAAAPAGGERYLLTLTMLDLETGTNVDLEGWIPTSAGSVVPSQAGEAAATWSGKAGKAGRYRLYVTAVPLDHTGAVTSSAPSELTVTAAPAPHTGPLMAVSVGEPVLVALAIGWDLTRRRRDARRGRERA